MDRKNIGVALVLETRELRRRILLHLSKICDDEFTERHKFAVHYDWKYKFLRPTIKQVVTRYKIKFHNLDPAVAAAASSRTLALSSAVR